MYTHKTSTMAAGPENSSAAIAEAVAFRRLPGVFPAALRLLHGHVLLPQG